VVGFLDDDPFKQGKLIHGYRVLGSLESIETIYQRMRFNEVIIAVSSIPEIRLNRLRMFARRYGVMLANFGLSSNTDDKVATWPEGLERDRHRHLPFGAGSG
jgi:FlaA1/EpsC-like NDP-sugar epimerase